MEKSAALLRWLNSLLRVLTSNYPSTEPANTENLAPISTLHSYFGPPFIALSLRVTKCLHSRTRMIGHAFVAFGVLLGIQLRVL